MSDVPPLSAQLLDAQRWARWLRATLQPPAPAIQAGPARASLPFPAALTASALALSNRASAAELGEIPALTPFGRVGPHPQDGKIAVTRISQTDPAEYDSPLQARTWGPVTCSAAALAAVLRSYGVPARIADVLRAAPGAVRLDVGLVSRSALVDAARRFGLDAADDVVDYAGLERATARGQPVLTDVVNGMFPEGHWIVVTGADRRGVNVVDSSGYGLTWIPKDDFTTSWLGRGIRIGGGTGQQAG